MTPKFMLEVLRTDITSKAMDHLEELRLVITSDSKTDYLEIILDDREGILSFSDESRTIQVRLGYSHNSQLSDMGTFIHTDTEYQISPQRLTIRATAADFTKNSKLKAPQTRSWDDISIGELVQQISAENRYIGRCSPDLSSIRIPHIDQTAESDLHLLRRIAHNYDAVFKTAGRFLIFTPRAGGLSATQQNALPVIRISPGQATRGRVSRKKRPAYRSVIASYHDFNTGNTVKVKAGEGEPCYEIGAPRPTREQAQADADAQLSRLNSQTAQLQLTLPGDPQITAENRLLTENFRDGVNGTWNINRAVHTLNNRGYYTEVTAEPVQLP